MYVTDGDEKKQVIAHKSCPRKGGQENIQEK